MKTGAALIFLALCVRRRSRTTARARPRASTSSSGRQDRQVGQRRPHARPPRLGLHERDGRRRVQLADHRRRGRVAAPALVRRPVRGSARSGCSGRAPHALGHGPPPALRGVRQPRSRDLHLERGVAALGECDPPYDACMGGAIFVLGGRPHAARLRAARARRARRRRDRAVGRRDRARARCSFASNAATSEGGAISMGGAGAHDRDGLDVRAEPGRRLRRRRRAQRRQPQRRVVVVSRNQAATGGALGVYLGALRLVECSLADNDAVNGGAIALVFGNVSLEADWFSDNAASYSGGDVHNELGRVDCPSACRPLDPTRGDGAERDRAACDAGALDCVRCGAPCRSCGCNRTRAARATAAPTPFERRAERRAARARARARRRRRTPSARPRSRWSRSRVPPSRSRSVSSRAAARATPRTRAGPRRNRHARGGPARGPAARSSPAASRRGRGCEFIPLRADDVADDAACNACSAASTSPTARESSASSATSSDELADVAAGAHAAARGRGAAHAAAREPVRCAGSRPCSTRRRRRQVRRRPRGCASCSGRQAWPTRRACPRSRAAAAESLPFIHAAARARALGAVAELLVASQLPGEPATPPPGEPAADGGASPTTMTAAAGLAAAELRARSRPRALSSSTCARASARCSSR